MIVAFLGFPKGSRTQHNHLQAVPTQACVRVWNSGAVGIYGELCFNCSSVCSSLLQSKSASFTATELVKFLLSLPAKVLIGANCNNRCPPSLGDVHICSLETGMRPTHFIQGTEHLSGGRDMQPPTVLAKCELSDLDQPPESLLNESFTLL